MIITFYLHTPYSSANAMGFQELIAALTFLTAIITEDDFFLRSIYTLF